MIPHGVEFSALTLSPVTEADLGLDVAEFSVFDPPGSPSDQPPVRRYLNSVSPMPRFPRKGPAISTMRQRPTAELAISAINQSSLPPCLPETHPAREVYPSSPQRQPVKQLKGDQTAIVYRTNRMKTPSQSQQNDRNTLSSRLQISSHSAP